MKGGLYFSIFIGNYGELLIGDFGQARSVPSSGAVEMSKDICPAIEPPEMRSGDIEIAEPKKLDVYAVGVVGYMAASGQIPITQKDIDLNFIEDEYIRSYNYLLTM